MCIRDRSIGSEIVGQSRPVAEDGAPAAGAPAPEAAAQLNITLSVPTGAAQRILSVDSSRIVLSLLPAGWTPTAQANEVLDDLLIDADLPGEDPNQITPDGPEGFIDELADELAAELEAGGEGEGASDVVIPEASTTDPVDDSQSQDGDTQ